MKRIFLPNLFFLSVMSLSQIALAMNCEDLVSKPKSVSQKSANYPERNGGVAIKNFDANKPADNDYQPVEFVAPIVLQNSGPGGWAAPEDPQLSMPFVSYEGPIKLDSSARPLNPKYFTGITNRGNLGKWGANFAADALVTRLNLSTNQYEMLAIQRKDTGEWAIPGGFVEHGEDASNAVLRELKEETGVDLQHVPGDTIYQGYVDDPRTTDNAWIETTVVHRHIDSPVTFAPQAGSDAAKVQWLPLTDQTLANMYASHSDFVRLALRRLQQTAP